MVVSETNQHRFRWNRADFAFGGEVDSHSNHRGNVRRALEDEKGSSAELQVKLLAEQNSTELVPSTNVTLKEETEERTDRFVHTTEDDCDPIWTSWPAVQEAAIANGTVLVLDIFSSVGNLFITLHCIIKTARLLEVALFLKWEKFQGFRAAFDPASIKWDLDPTTLVQQAEELTLGAEAKRLYPFKFLDGNLVLSSRQLETLARQTGIPDASSTEMAAAVKEGWGSLRQLSKDIVGFSPGSPEPCAWNMFLRRSPSMMASLEDHNPWTPSGYRSISPRPKDYVAWHIRTSDGESKQSFRPNVHTYIFHGQSSSTVFQIFLSAADIAEEMCPKIVLEDTPKMPVYISSNSKSMARNCTALAAKHEIRAGFVDLGIEDLDAHTTFSKNPNATALNAFIDYMYLMDSSIIVQTGSSFSSTVASIKGLKCSQVEHSQELPVKRLKVCLPSDC